MALQKEQPGQPEIELREITPDQAREWLLQNGHNRPLRQSTLRYFMEALRQDRAATTHQGIAFDVNGNLQDGQHRLQAIVNTGKSWPLYVTWNMPVDNFHLIDIGAKRTNGDFLAIRGYPNHNHLAAVTRFAANWDRGWVSFSQVFRDDQLDELLKRYPALVKADRVASKDLGVSSAALSLMVFLADDEAFAEDLLNDTPDSTRPGGLLAVIYRGRADAKKSSDHRFNFAVMVKARNDQFLGVNPSRKYGQKSAEAFPQPAWNPPIPFGRGDEEEDN